MIYLDNAATGGFKPNSVTSSAQTVMKFLCANPGRSGHRLSLAGAKIVYDCRKKASELFDAIPDRVIFTKNCTEALNVAIFGIIKKGMHVITTVYEHNSVLRPLYSLYERGDISLSVISDKETTLDNALKKCILPNTGVVICTAISNVTGKILPIRNIGKICKENGIKFIVDGAQGGGHIPLSLKQDYISALCLAGHKGLFGIMGSGLLIFDEQTEISPLILGGTGTESFNPRQPSAYPERLESGTLNLPAIAGLLEGLIFTQKNLENFGEQLCLRTEKVINSLNEIDKVKCYSEKNPAGIISFLIDGTDSGEVADILNRKYDIAVRSGLHCAPKTHEYLNTDKSGLVRASFSVFNSAHEITCFLYAIRDICR